MTLKNKLQVLIAEAGKLRNARKGAFNVDAMLNILFVVLIFTSLIGTIATSIVGAQGGNVTGAASTLLGLTTLIITIVFVRSMIKGKGGR